MGPGPRPWITGHNLCVYYIMTRIWAKSIAGGLGVLAVLGATILLAATAAAQADTLDEVIEALKIREHLLASRDECRAAALNQVQRQIDDSVQARLAGRSLDSRARERLDELSRTYAREACRFGIEEGLIQRYKTAYAAALSKADLAALQRFLLSPEGKNFVAASLAANSDVVRAIRRRQEIQATRAVTLLQGRLDSFFTEHSDDR